MSTADEDASLRPAMAKIFIEVEAEVQLTSTEVAATTGTGGAPVEEVCAPLVDFIFAVTNGAVHRLQVNPLGHEVTLLSAVMLNLGQTLGSGIFSVPGVVLNSLGSAGLSLSFWVISPIFSLGSWLPFNDVVCSCRGLLFFLLPLQPPCSATPNLPAFFPDDLVRRWYF
jgi:hypothetical protein